jgi:hypothetical protein
MHAPKRVIQALQEKSTRAGRPILKVRWATNGRPTNAGVRAITVWHALPYPPFIGTFVNPDDFGIH